MKKVFLYLALILFSCCSISTKNQDKESSKFYLFFCAAATYSELNFEIFNEVMYTNYEKNDFFMGNGVYNINDSLNLISYYINSNDNTYISICSFSHNKFNSKICLKETHDIGVDLVYDRKASHPAFKVKLYEKDMEKKPITKNYIFTYNLKYDIFTKKFIFDKQLEDFIK